MPSARTSRACRRSRRPRPRCSPTPRRHKLTAAARTACGAAARPGQGGRMSRRRFLHSSAALFTLASTGMWAAAAPPAPAATPFDYARLKGLARTRAGQRYAPEPLHTPPALAALDWDHWQAIRFRDERSVWAQDGLRFQVRFAHLGYTLQKPVRMYEVANGA